MGKCECGRLKGNPCGPLRPNTINVTMPGKEKSQGRPSPSPLQEGSSTTGMEQKESQQQNWPRRQIVLAGPINGAGASCQREQNADDQRGRDATADPPGQEHEQEYGGSREETADDDVGSEKRKSTRHGEQTGHQPVQKSLGQDWLPPAEHERPVRNRRFG